MVLGVLGVLGFILSTETPPKTNQQDTAQVQCATNRAPTFFNSIRTYKTKDSR